MNDSTRKLTTKRYERANRPSDQQPGHKEASQPREQQPGHKEASQPREQQPGHKEASQPREQRPVIFIRPEDRSEAEQWVCDLASETAKALELAIVSGRDAHLEKVIENYRRRRREGEPVPNLDTPIVAVMNEKEANVLAREGYYTLGQICTATESELLRINGVYRSTIHKINDALTRVVLAIQLTPEHSMAPDQPE
jgi:hypothetical protein